MSGLTGQQERFLKSWLTLLPQTSSGQRNTDQQGSAEIRLEQETRGYRGRRIHCRRRKRILQGH